MQMSEFVTEEGWFFVDIIEPTKEQVKEYYKNTGEIESSSTNDKPRIFKKAVIRATFDEEKYPIGSEWMIGETLGMKINYMGNKIMLIKQKDLYARIAK